ncbi:MAG: peptidase T [Acutalibacter sp.]|jgi:tripeptide aminopeptidase
MSVKEVFLDLVSYPTASDETTGTTPSTPGQKVLGAHIVEHMKSIGITDAHMDDMGYVYGTIPATDTRKNTIGFIAHMDTYGGVSGENIKPQVIENYDGSTIALGQSGLTLSPEAFPTLKNHVGKTLITTDGTTLLGGDDKAGVAEILCAAEEILKEGKPHGTVKIGFTPDEEIGEGADHFDVEGFGCDYAYTVDGGTLGGLDYENFNAASAVVEVEGVSTHTGGAKGKMVNSMSVAMEYCSLLPKDQLPEVTEGREGFIHLDSIKGNVSHTTMQFLIRDHDKELFRQKKELMGQAASYINVKYPTQPLTLTVKDTYYNMCEMILPRMEIIENMKRAMLENGVEPHTEPVRGGTDGARLSFMGLPCPNICTGGENAHGKTEYVVLDDMETIKDIIKTAVYLVD